MSIINTKARVAGSLAYWDNRHDSDCPFCTHDKGSKPCREWHDGYQSTKAEVEGGTDTVPLHELELGESGA
jgi:hypothetical protein